MEQPKDKNMLDSGQAVAASTYGNDRSALLIAGYPIAATTAIGAAAGYSAAKAKATSMKPALEYAKRVSELSKASPVEFRRGYISPQSVDSVLSLIRTLPGGDRISPSKRRQELAANVLKKIDELDRLEQKYGKGLKGMIMTAKKKADLLSSKELDELTKEDRLLLKKIRRYVPIAQRYIERMPLYGALKGGAVGLGAGALLGLLAYKSMQGDSNG